MQQPENSQTLEKKQKRGNTSFVVIVIIILLLIAAGLGYLGRMWWIDHGGEKSSEEVKGFIRQTVSVTLPSMELQDNPVDFEKLQAINSDLYAWIKVPGTRVDYPIAQGNDDSFYLHHDFRKNYLFAGTLYTELCNEKDFCDPITVIYGHNMYASEGTMFTTLHSFEDKSFFEKHKSFTIYTPGHILTYRIFSAFKYDNRHIMNSFDFSFEKDLQEFQSTMLQPHSTLKHVREGVTLTSEDKVVVLSTCFSGDKSVRFLVCGVLEKDELTK